ncbi:MAG: M28 family peptidase [Gemmatimonadota bacterium]
MYSITRHAIVTALLAAGCAPATTVISTPAATPGPGVTPAVVAPTASELRRDLFAFADDSFRGRETGTPDADRAAHWLVARLMQLGLEPAGDSGFYQRVPMDRTRTTLAAARVTRNGAVTQLAEKRDIVVLSSLGPGAPLPRIEADADIVFAGYALRDSSRDDLRGLQVGGKVVVIVGDVPPGSSEERGMQAVFNRVGPLFGQGPAAIVLLLPDSLYSPAAGALGGVQLALRSSTTSPRPTTQTRLLPMIAFAPLRPDSPLLPPGGPSASPGPLTGHRLAATLTTRDDVINGYNVVAVARGSDARMRNTYVAYGAHYDHVGIQPSSTSDSIANGADDDASGSVALLALARSWMQGPRPRRSALFVWHVGEEKGLFGSEYFTNNPTVPIDSIVAQINADMIGRNSDDSLYIVGPGAAPNGQSLVLGSLVDSANAALPKPFTFDRTWDSQDHPERIYFRSDHYNYARKGIPIVFLTTGLHGQYHQVTDEANLINYPKLERVAGLMYTIGVIVGNREERPRPAPRAQ